MNFITKCVAVYRDIATVNKFLCVFSSADSCMLLSLSSYEWELCFHLTIFFLNGRSLAKAGANVARRDVLEDSSHKYKDSSEQCASYCW